MWIPTPLYEALPYLVLVIGGACIVGAINLLMLTSGGLLVLCGGAIWKLRRDYRMQNRLVELQHIRFKSSRRRSSHRIVQLDGETG